MFSLKNPLAEYHLSAQTRALVAGRTLRVDSRQVQPGDVFVACQGEYADGRDFIQAAIDKGAVFVFWDDDGRFRWQASWKVANEAVVDLRQRAGLVAAACYDYPGRDLSIWGVTGTNGKTSVSQWLAQAADILGKKCAIMGTVGNGYWQQLHDSVNTTMDAVANQTWLRRFVQEDATAVAMEVSSHGLDQSRVVGVPFASAVFTNLTRDHLDYHHSMRNYGACKASLFYWSGLQHAVINIDDEFGYELWQDLRRARSHLTILAYGFHAQADIHIYQFQASASGMQIHLRTPWGEGVVHTRLLGRFNAQNLAACVGVLCANGFAFDDVLAVWPQIHPATGRMDCLMGDKQPLVVVDYAHTPDALEKALATLQEIKPAGAHLWCVFGCGGDRDAGKRPLMGAAADAGADCVVVTSDNPRTENPQAIIADILPAIKAPVLVEADRGSAIHYAVQHAAIGDIVLIAGKGHETYQDIGGQKQHFSDFEVAQAALRQRA
ncbi:UDP-N-acetylmuramoyl-L-alanyl-D-glutamate--2,6-diaminopimelate ligase [Snodgrassella communis]|uniref:UDP-N-acetylmuramoyl-L-alanyl-D-glutamate--2,6-diaminopimelate ligase n=1 Tax=Snodgrassella alvi TaxID=1196083 RepID=A0A2N9XRN8_9NEIS|nr:UDP-N-acetylmuramoyl-L-alanyl-D-glutamate--2,6-diaminopimelate ligase [Snodgrassella communis]PIT51255.1 UDP-N-acetylmuramoyl-L-alanyl-D-glutamate--2,6-diaminopimelate ligase [Snodgrassella communis]